MIFSKIETGRDKDRESISEKSHVNLFNRNRDCRGDTMRERKILIEKY